MLQVNPKLQKANCIIATIIVWAIVAFGVLVFIGFILEVLFNKGILETDFHTTFFDHIELVIFIILAILLGLLVPGVIISSKVPAREDIVDDQLLTILQRTEAIEKKICQHDKEISAMEEQLRATTPSPLHNLTPEQEQAIVDKLILVSKSPKNPDLINRASTAHFLRALQLCGLIDKLESPVDLRRWVEQKTNRTEPGRYYFNEAYTNSTKDDKKVQEMVVVIQSLLK